MKKHSDNIHPSLAPADVSLTVDSRRAILFTFWVCLLAELAYVLLDATVNYSQWTSFGMIRRLFNITREDGYASWFGVTQNFMVAVTVWWIWIFTKRVPGARRQARGWLILAFVLTYMAMDDGAQIHERLGSAFKKASAPVVIGGDDGGLGSAILGLFPSYPWQVLFLPIFGAAGIFMLVFLLKTLRSKLSTYLVVAGLACFVVATGIDFIEGLDEHHSINVYGHLARTNDWDVFTAQQFGQTPYESMRHFGKSVEEFLEMFGMTLIWVAILRHIGGRFRKIELEMVAPPDMRSSK